MHTSRWRLRHVAAFYLSLGALVGFGLRDIISKSGESV